MPEIVMHDYNDTVTIIVLLIIAETILHVLRKL